MSKDRVSNYILLFLFASVTEKFKTPLFQVFGVKYDALSFDGYSESFLEFQSDSSMNLACMMDGQNNQKKLKLLSIGIAPHDGLFSIGVSPHGLISIGAIPHGLISIGLVPMGVVSIGLVSMGLFSTGAIAMGLIGFGRVNMSLMPLNPTHIQQNQPETQMNPHHNMSH